MLAEFSCNTAGAVRVKTAEHYSDTNKEEAGEKEKQQGWKQRRKCDVALTLLVGCVGTMRPACGGDAGKE